MTDQEKLYETLGELLYAVAMADGVIQQEEKIALNKILKDHNWSSEINWSFNYEVSKGQDVQDIYKKAISFCQSYGPAPEYEEFIEAMEIIAKASEKIEASEARIIEGFSSDLIKKFRKDLGFEK